MSKSSPFPSSSLPLVEVVENVDINSIPQDIFDSEVPIVLKGLVKNWPLVQKGLNSPQMAVKYLKSHYNGKPAGAYYGSPEIEGRYFYNDTLSACNFSIKKTQLDEFLDSIIEHLNAPQPPSFYIASNDIKQHFPTLLNDNDICFDPRALGGVVPRASIWIGNKTLVSCHYDELSNIACCAIGHRRFTLFPPAQIENLYPGPFHPTPGGQVVSMVDFSNPDYVKFPKFKQALEHACIADLSPGDALFLPTMWWHQVESFDRFNTLVNYWWTPSHPMMGKASTVLMHALLSLRDQPELEKAAWKHIFDYYVFADPDLSREHLPEHTWGVLAPPNDIRARQLKANILNKLNR
ncbi:cupin-like domain-containing protein [Agaribacter flavus]|uniref:Cupin-like domain-containing protein n=1 Tax=Agaribacter flavus TaxID=1902781 RepID=A0ABV7FTI5_9ALTE